MSKSLTKIIHLEFSGMSTSSVAVAHSAAGRSRKCATIFFTNKKQKNFSSLRGAKPVQYIQGILLLPKSWCENVKHITIPRGERRSKLAEHGMLGKISFTSKMAQEEVAKEVCRVFIGPMSLSEMDI